jgi:hypothetical protein
MLSIDQNRLKRAGLGLRGWNPGGQPGTEHQGVRPAAG